MTDLVRGFARIALLAGVVVVSSAHVGSPNAFYVGKAGPYDVNIIVRPASVIPGLAEITVRLSPDQAQSVRRVLVRPVYWTTGTAGSPAAEEAVRVAAAEPIYAGKLWLMRPGSYSVHVTVEGDAGSATATVPVGATPTARLALGGSLQIILVGLGLVLVVGMLTIVHAAAGEGLTARGVVPEPRIRLRARLATAAAVPLLALIVLGGWRWWEAEARAYERSLYRPLPVRVTIDSANARGRLLTLAVIDSAWVARNITPVIPDHGKMMHMFMVREPALDGFAHLHPSMPDSNTFVTALPATLPAGRYRLYGDIVHESGFERTLVSTVDVPASAAASGGGARVAPALDVDDAWLATSDRPTALVANAAASLGDGFTLRYLGTDGIRVDSAVVLRFQVRDGRGNVTVLEPYMGMSGHAVVSREDGAVFAHVHPMGTVTMAAQQAFAMRDRGDTTEKGRLRFASDTGARHTMMAVPPTDTVVGFPYAFPRDGSYRLWVQVRLAGAVRTGVFHVRVARPRAAE